MTTYDEDLKDNPFHRELLKSHSDLLERASQEKWIICVPRKASILKPITFIQITEHIIIPDVTTKTYSTLNKTPLKIKNDCISIKKNKRNEAVITRKILFKETYYVKGLKYYIFCLDGFLDESGENLNFTNVTSLRDCIEFLKYETNGNEILIRINDACEEFLLRHEDLNSCSVQDLENSTQELFAKCLLLTLKFNYLDVRIKRDKSLMVNLRVAVETYMQSCLNSQVFNVICACFLENDAHVNKAVRNLQNSYFDYEKCPNFHEAKHELGKINRSVTTLGKFNCIKNAFGVLSKKLTAEDLIEIFAFLIIHSQVNNWTANLIYLQRFNFSQVDSAKFDQRSFLLTTFEAALEYVKSGILAETERLNESDSEFIEVIRAGDLDKIKELFGSTGFSDLNNGTQFLWLNDDSEYLQLGEENPSEGLKNDNAHLRLNSSDGLVNDSTNLRLGEENNSDAPESSSKHFTERIDLKIGDKPCSDGLENIREDLMLGDKNSSDLLENSGECIESNFSDSDERYNLSEIDGSVKDIQLNEKNCDILQNKYLMDESTSSDISNNYNNCLGSCDTVRNQINFNTSIEHSNQFNGSADVKQSNELINRFINQNNQLNGTKTNVLKTDSSVDDIDGSNNINIFENNCGALKSLDENNSNKIRKKSLTKVLRSETFCHPLCACDSCQKINSLTYSPDYKDEKGRNGLHIACYYGYPHIVEYFIQKGVDVNAPDYLNTAAIHHAANRGHQNALLLLLHSGADLNLVDGNGNTALHLGSWNGHESCVKALLYYSEHVGKKLVIDSQNVNGDTALHLAVNCSYVGIIKILLQYGANLNVRNKKGKRVVDTSSNYRVKKMLLGKNIQPEFKPSTITELKVKNVNNEQLKRIELLLKAIEYNDLPLTCFYLHIPVPVLQKQKSINEHHPLCDCDECCFGENNEEYREVLYKFNNQSINEIQEVTSQQISSLKEQQNEHQEFIGSNEILSVSRQDNIDVNGERSDGTSQFKNEDDSDKHCKEYEIIDNNEKTFANYKQQSYEEIKSNEITTVSKNTYCIESNSEKCPTNGESKNSKVTHFKKQRIDFIDNETKAKLKRIEPLDCKQEQKLNVNAIDANGYTPLHVAAKFGRKEILRLLLDKGANVNARTEKTLYTPLHLACINQRLSIVKELLQCGSCEMDSRDFKGNTGAHYACFKNDLKVLEVLLVNGCDVVGIRNNEGKSVLQEAEDMVLTDAVKLIKEKCVVSCVLDDDDGFLLC